MGVWRGGQEGAAELDKAGWQVEDARQHELHPLSPPAHVFLLPSCQEGSSLDCPPTSALIV